MASTCTCGKPGTKALECENCHTVAYCSEPHKKAHTEAHSKQCAGLAVASSKGWTKEVLREGTAAGPSNGALVEMHYEGCLTNGKVFDSSRPKNRTFKFSLGEGQVIQGWDKGVASMKTGEKCVLYLRPDHGYGARGAGGVIPPNAYLIFECELISWTE